MTNKTALILGATGLVGGELLDKLLKDNRYNKINLISRRPIQLEDSDAKKVSQFITPLEDNGNPFQAVDEAFNVDHVYVCLGTTIKKAGSKAAFRFVDYELVFLAAKLSALHRVASFVWVSSVGADANSQSFYLAVKGELEDAIYQLGGLASVAVRPSLLIGERDETRPSEAIGIVVGKILSPIMLGKLAKYRPVHAQDVARQMISLQSF